MSEENLTPDELKYICEVFFKNNSDNMIKKLIARQKVAFWENNVVLLKNLTTDIITARNTFENQIVEKKQDDT